METMFSVGSAPRLYNEDPWPAELEVNESHETTVEDDGEEMTTSLVEIWKSAREEKTLHVIITVLKSVARIQLVKTEKPGVCVTVNCKL
jgi:hypothetical protein